MGVGDRGPYSATSSALGYFYQCRYALLEALRRLPKGDLVSIGIETLDDVVFEQSGLPLDILQTKHHINSLANLTDYSPDVWKTLRIWIEGQSNGSIPLNARFFLITTATCQEGTAVACLRSNKRDEGSALTKWIAVASTSENKDNKSAYKAFLDLDGDKRKNLIEAITVLDSSQSIGDLDQSLIEAVFFAVERKFLNQYLSRLESWWYSRVIKHLHEPSPSLILAEELEAETTRLRNQLKEDNLPIDDSIMQATIDISGYLNQMFVEQLKLVGVNSQRIAHAINNYYRAFEQRSRWLREDLLYVGELDRYEARLIEEWDIIFQQMRDDLGDNAAEEAKINAAKELYKWVESSQHHLIRPAVNNPIIARGTYQLLADELKVGWHVEFKERLQALLESTYETMDK